MTASCGSGSRDRVGDAVANHANAIPDLRVVVGQEVTLVPGESDQPVSRSDGCLLPAVDEPGKGLLAELILGSVNRVHVVDKGLAHAGLDCLGNRPHHCGVQVNDVRVPLPGEANPGLDRMGPACLEECNALSIDDLAFALFAERESAPTGATRPV